MNEYVKSIDTLDSDFILSELDNVLKVLKNNKAPGHDHILNEFLFNASDVLKKTLLCLFNKLLALEYFPTVWSSGTIKVTNWIVITIEASSFSAVFLKFLRK